MGMVWVGYRRNEAAVRELLGDPDLVGDLLESDDDTAVDLDKAWHALHWLLTAVGGNAEQAVSDAILGGEEVGEDLGYGPARLLPPERVEAVARALAQIDVASLRSRMDPQAMEAAEVYPMIWDEDDVFGTYLAPAYDRLRDFYSAAAAAHEAVIHVVC